MIVPAWLGRQNDGPGYGDDEKDWKGMFRNSFKGVEVPWRGKTGKRRCGVRKQGLPIDAIQLRETTLRVKPKWLRSYMGAPSASWSMPSMMDGDDYVKISAG